MKLLVTIDVEEDNWGEYSPTSYTLRNLRRIPLLQNLFDEFGVKPTYLINYPVATDTWAIDTFSAYLAQGKCEIGMHCHPWNTPPYDKCEEGSMHNTMLCNLPDELQHLKLSSLHEVICKNFGIAPVSFRAGRWGFGPAAGRSLTRLGFRIDTSVTPFVDWKNYHGPDFSLFGPEPFRFNGGDLSLKDEKGALLQVPATIGFTQSNFRLCHLLMKALQNRCARTIHLVGILDHVRLLNKVWFSPELSDAGSLIRLARRMAKDHYSCLNMTFHSTSLLSGLSPFVRTVEEERAFLRKIRTFLEFARTAGWQSQTLTQFEEGFRPSESFPDKVTEARS